MHFISNRTCRTVMMKTRNKVLISSLVMLQAMSSHAFAETDKQTITISTGSVSGVYYPVGGAICRLLNKTTNEHHLRCTVDSSEGSLSNIERLRNHQTTLAIVQSNIQQHAYNGTNEYQQTGAFPELRALFGLYKESFTIVVRNDKNIQSLQDLKGKRIDLGNPGSGERVSMDKLLAHLHWSTKDFSNTSELKADDRAQALCDNKIDAFVYMVGHPNGVIREAANNCNATILPIDSSTLSAFLAENKDYTATTIPKKLYRGVDADTQTFGVVATLVTTESAEQSVIYQVVKSTMEHMSILERGHSVLRNLEPEDMSKTGISIPYHKGASQYYREAHIGM